MAVSFAPAGAGAGGGAGVPRRRRPAGARKLKGSDYVIIKKIPGDKLPDVFFEKGASDTVRLKQSGNIVQITRYENLPSAPPVRKLDKDRYQYTADIKDFETGNIIHVLGEIGEYKHTESRADDKAGVRRSLAKLRDLINANVTDTRNVRWCTLTYAENMRDAKRLYEDFKKFNMRFRYWLENHDLTFPQYIAVAEPQGRGAWHMHVLYIWDSPAPYLDNDSVFAPLWGHGFTKVKALRGDMDNLGAYLSAYLGDMEFSEYEKLSDSEKVSAVRGGCEIVEKAVDVRGKRVKKRIIKGARLALYPPGFNIFRCSRGVKRPVERWVKVGEAKKKVGSAKPTFSYGVEISDVSDTGKLQGRNKIVKTYYNLYDSVCQEEVSTVAQEDTVCLLCGRVGSRGDDFPVRQADFGYCADCASKPGWFVPGARYKRGWWFHPKIAAAQAAARKFLGL